MAILSLIAMLAVGQATKVEVSSNPEWWTYVPAAISALAALLTFSITFFVWWRRTDERSRDQASRVFVECERQKLGDDSLEIAARVWNRSDTPIGHVEVWPRRDGDRYAADIDQPLPEILPAQSYIWHWTVSKEHAAEEEPQPELTFVDAAERAWTRVGLSLRRG